MRVPRFGISGCTVRGDLSEASLQSERVMTELRKARKAERQSGQRKLFPVRLVDMETRRDWECFDADSGKEAARTGANVALPRPKPCLFGLAPH
jgi:hypothetical protein